MFESAFARKISRPNAFSAQNHKLQYISCVVVVFHRNFVEMERGSKRSIYLYILRKVFLHIE